MKVLVSIDRAICDSSDRDRMIGSFTWEEYHEEGKNDKPIKEMIHLVNALAKDGHEVIGYTMRPEKYRQLINRWMLQHQVMFNDIVMREDQDHRVAADVRFAMVSQIKPDLIIDRRL